MQRGLLIKSGEITAFLALILVVLIAFVFSILECASVVAGRAYFSLVVKMSGDNLMSEFNWPLFNDYGILAIDAGYGKNYKRDSESQSRLLNSVKEAFENKKGGLIGASSIGVSLEGTDSLVDGKYNFMEQVREQTILDGVQTMLESFIGQKKSGGAAELPQVYEAQKKAMEKVATVTSDLLKVMEIADGVRMSETGFYGGENDALVGADCFVKQFGIGDEGKMKDSYGDNRVFELVKERIVFHLEEVTTAREMLEKILKTQEEDAGNKKSEEEQTDYTEMEAEDRNREELSKGDQDKEEWDKENQDKEDTGQEATADEADEEATTKKVISAAEEKVAEIRRVVEEQIKITDILILRLEEVLIKQELAANYLDQYETEIRNIPGIASELLDGLLQEALEFRDYAALKNCGVDIGAMLEECAKNRLLLTAVLPFLQEENTPETKLLGLVFLEQAISEMSYEKVKFNYSGITTKGTKGDDIRNSLSSISAKGLFNLLGLDEVSVCSLTGLALPSEEKNSGINTDLLMLFSETMESFYDNGFERSLIEIGKSLSDDALLELYCSNHFGNYATPNPYTVLDYEREYILFGHIKDSDNLQETAGRLIALRSVLNYLSILCDGARMASASAAAISAVGWFAPELYVPVKYALITVWAIEEGILDTAALFAGKKLMLYPTNGRIYLGELVMFSPSFVKTKLAEIPNFSAGIGYEDYITFMSFFRINTKKELRILDLIQENIRLRYNDSFRIQNCITGVTYKAKAVAKSNFPLPCEKDGFYDISVRTTASFARR